jgi:hypothetical protein
LLAISSPSGPNPYLRADHFKGGGSLAIAAACGLTIAESQALVIGEAVAVIAGMALVAVNK